jgi:hypothetical protein
MQVKEWSFTGQLFNTFTAHESFISQFLQIIIQGKYLHVEMIDV